MLLVTALAGASWPAVCISGEADDTARLIAGLSRADSRGEMRADKSVKAEKGSGRSYAQETSSHWSTYESRIGRAMRSWGCQELPSAPGATIFYPFSGPDLPSVYQLFPDADRYVLVSMQKAEAPPRLDNLSDAQLENYLTAFRRAWRFFGVLGFFRTDDLDAVAYTQGLHLGMTGPLMAFAVRLGFEIDAVEPIKFDRVGDEVLLRALRRGEAESWDSVRLTLRRGARKILVDYVRLDLSDGSLGTSVDVRKWLYGVAANPAMLKAASHLPQESGFSILRDSILANAPVIVQDESGIEYGALAQDFAVRLYGKFTRPNSSFEKNLQGSLAAAYRNGAAAARKLPFSYGYEKSAGSAVQVAIRKSDAAQPPRSCK